MPVEKSTYVVQNVEPWCYVVDGVNEEYYFGNFICVHEWQHTKMYQSGSVVGCVIQENVFHCSLLHPFE